MKIIATNKKAGFNYFIKDKYEAGISLKGDEVKSIRQGHISLVEGFVDIKNSSAFLSNVFIKKYDNTGGFGLQETRTRRLLLKKSELKRLQKYKAEKGFTIVPLKVYFNNKGLIKIEIAVAQGKKLHDKRETIKQRDLNRSLNRELSKHN